MTTPGKTARGCPGGSGAWVTQASSVAAALQVLTTNHIDVLSSDIGMPGEDGYSLQERVRSSHESLATRGSSALALTAYARAEDRSKALFSIPWSSLDPDSLVEVVASLVHP